MPIKSLSLRVVSWLFALILFAPILALLIEAFSKPTASFQHLADTVLWDYVKNSLILVFGVCLMAVFWGLPSAWLTVRYQFPGHRFFRWALLLPMALPAYIVAYVYTDLLDYSGVVQQTIRELFQYESAQDYWFFDIRTMGGAIFVLSLVFSPYVYWISSLSFNAQCQSLVHASRLLNHSELKTFFRVVLPLSRPALALACSLVAMETLADFGTVSYFSVWNITTAIYDTWLSLFDLPTAAKLASLLLLFVVALVVLEKASRRKVPYYNEKTAPLIRYPLQGKYRWIATAWCSLVLFLGFVLPVSMIAYYAAMYVFETDWVAFFSMLKYSFLLATSVATLATGIAFVVQLNQRLNKSKPDSFPKQISRLGYAVPGTVLAIGVLIITTNIDGLTATLSGYLGWGAQALLIAGSLVAMGYALLCRFSAISMGSVASGMDSIPESLDNSAYLFHVGAFQAIKKLFLPLLKNSLLTAFMLVFLESMKELSATILLRPFNVETLATYVYQYMSAEAFEVAALPALVIVLAGIPPVIILTTLMGKR